MDPRVRVHMKNPRLREVLPLIWVHDALKSQVSLTGLAVSTSSSRFPTAFPCRAGGREDRAWALLTPDAGVSAPASGWVAARSPN